MAEAEPRKLLDRRQALGALGVLGIGAVAAACSSNNGSPNAAKASTTSTSTTNTSSSSTTLTTSSTSSSAAACTLTPEATEGPFYLDINDVRQDITEGKAGAPLALNLTVVDASSCRAIKDAAIDIWHCDAGGQYSGVQGSSGTTFLRGTQLADANGAATFDTIYPGWYQGRAVHIHMKVHVDNHVVHTGQLFFDDSLSDKVFQDAPYNARGSRDTRNGDDSIFSDAGGSSAILPVTSDGSNYKGSITVGVKTSASYD
jgi:protocatechuate 3,4-dioxygenase beta subunit